MPRKFKPKAEAPDQNTPVPGQTYGQRKDTQQALDVAPPNQPEDRRSRLQRAAQQTNIEPVGIGAPPSPAERSRFPETAGLPFGRGPGPEANRVLSLSGPEQVTDEQRRAAQLLPLMERIAEKPGASSTVKRLVRSLRAQAANVRGA